MGASASLQTTEITVTPGSETLTELRVRNTGTVVDQFTFTPIGTAQGWITVEPPQVSLFPGAEETVRVLFRPPRSHTTSAGPSPFAVKVNSREDPEGSVVEEGVVNVEAFGDLSLELIPRTSRARRSAKPQVAIDNRGNARANVELTAFDADEQLSFAVDPQVLAVEPGTAQFADVRVTPRKRFWRGPAVTKPFQVVATEEGKEPLVTDGGLLQEALLPKWFWKAVLALLALLLLLLILWQTVLKPSIQSEARDAAAGEVAAVEDRLNFAGIPTVPPNIDAGAGGSTTIPPPDGGGGGGGGGLVPTTTGPDGQPGTTLAPPTAALGDPFDIRLVAQAPLAAPAGPGGPGTPGTFTVPAGRVYSLTDMVLQNPNGDSGRMTVLRGNDVILESALENFRDLDYHFVAPYVFQAGDNLTVSITCTAVGQAGGDTCFAAASFNGFLSP
jgi:hypothetical protein